MAYENRLNWTDVEWAKHLGCPVEMVTGYREWVNNNYIAYIAQNPATKRYMVVVDRFDYAPSGWKRCLPMITSERQFISPSIAEKYAERKFIPSLQLAEYNAKIHSVPAKAIQMLKIR